MKTKKPFWLAALALAGFVLASCSGGGSGTIQPQPKQAHPGSRR